MERVGPAQADNLVSSGQLGRRRGVVAGEDEAGGEAALGGFVGDLIGVGEEGHGEGTALPDLVFQGAERLVERVDDEVEGAVTAVASDGVWVGVDDEGGGADDAGGGRETRPCRTGKGGVDKFSGPAHGPADELAVEGEGVGLERGLFGRLVQGIWVMGGAESRRLSLSSLSGIGGKGWGAGSWIAGVAKETQGTRRKDKFC